MSQEQLRASIARFVNLDDEEFGRFFSAMRPLSLKKGELLLAEGQVCNEVFFIESGCLRYYYLSNGEERVGQFFFENGWVSDMYSFLTRQPSQMNIAAIEPSNLLALSQERLHQLYDEVPKTERFGRRIIENTFVAVQQRNASFLTMTPEEKYEALVRTRPKVVARVPQYMIASYLGIQPESLSRIRKKMARRDGDYTS